ncbi:MAG TPA: GWxTD domain-containing protein [Candidatus Kapabacteria bacterium]|nr:GWxTD domain-containing protein [Candidatus Kapabacteria bacterium]
MKYRLFLSAALLAVTPIVLRAQNALEADAVAFRYDSTHAQAEIDYGVLERGLAFKNVDGVWMAFTSAKAEIWQNGRVAQERDIHDTVRCPCTQAQLDSAGANKLLGSTGFSIPYGDTTTAAFLWRTGEKDGHSVFDTIVIPLILPDRDTSKFSLSGVELAAQVEKSSGQPSPFEKAGYIVTPNPSAIFGENYTKLYYYTELYVPRAAVDPAQSVDIVTSVIDPSGAQILSSTEKVPLAGTVIPIILGIDIDGMAGDSYKLHIQVKYQNGIATQAEKTFYYASDIKLSEAPPAPPSSLAADSILFAGSDLAKLTDAEADEQIEQSMYWGDDADKTAAKKLTTVDEKRAFLFSFWRAEDEKLHSAQPLDAYRLFMNRVAEANKQFSYQKTPGWKSSRGRVWITYGPPPQRGITNVPYDPAYKPYIIWQYDPGSNIRLTNGNIPEFDFVDRMGGGNYFLVNSNAVGESYDPNWMTTEALRLAH